MRLIFATCIALVLLAAVVLPSSCSLLSLFDRAGSPLSAPLPDPFRILEQLPFGLVPDDAAAVLPARVDWKETADAHLIMIDVPGMKRDELKIEVEGNRVLRISGERKREEEREGDHWHCVERVQGRFWRQFRLPDNVDLDRVDAKLADGVLTVVLKKLAPDQIKGPRVISIGGGEAEKGQLGDGAGGAKRVEL